jgi:hypothetical protein
VLAYIHDTDVETLNRLVYTQTPEDVVATFPYLSDLEKKVRLPGRRRPLPARSLDFRNMAASDTVTRYCTLGFAA